MNQLSKNNLVIITIPFVLTGLLIIVGYQLLTAGTPEAKVTIPQQSSQIEILTEDITDIIQPTNPTPKQIIAKIQTVPDNRAQLAEAINTALNTSANTIYLSLPVNVGADSSLVLANVDASSEENISRWVKKTANTAHQNGLHVILALTLNASTVINSPDSFAQNYQSFVVKWAKLATEFGISFLNSGITVGHPVYSNLSALQFNQLLKASEHSLRQYYTGKIGVGICCNLNSQATPSGFNFVVIIPTDNVPASLILPTASQTAAAYQMTHIFSYDRTAGQVIQVVDQTR